MLKWCPPPPRLDLRATQIDTPPTLPPGGVPEQRGDPGEFSDSARLRQSSAITDANPLPFRYVFRVYSVCIRLRILSELRVDCRRIAGQT